MDTVISMYELNELTALEQLLHRLCVFVHEAIECGDAAKFFGGGSVPVVSQLRRGAARLTSECKNYETTIYVC